MAKLRKLVIGAPRTGEKDETEVRWLISYSDFMMQLVCLFILLYSVSSLDKGRMARVAAAYRASVGIGEAAAYESRSAGDKLAVGDRSLIGGALGGGDLLPGLLYRVETVPGGFRGCDYWLWGWEAFAAVPRVDGERVVVLGEPAYEPYELGV